MMHQKEKRVQCLAETSPVLLAPRIEAFCVVLSAPFATGYDGGKSPSHADPHEPNSQPK